MSPTLLAVVLILGGYVYGTMLYEPWYKIVQTWVAKTGLVKLPDDNPNARLLGNQVQIAIGSLVLIGIGIYLFIFAR
jgi:hypothetical protein